MTLREITRGTPAFAIFVQHLTEASLPSEDLLEEGGRYYALGEVAANILAFGGLVARGPDALLRSIVIPAAARGRGRGAQMVEALVDMAKAEGIRCLWLLTTDAEAYFAARGFETVARDAAPVALAELRQLRGMCPASAALMRRPLP